MASALSDIAKRPERRAVWLVAPALLLLAVFLVLPYFNIIVMSLRVPAAGAPYGPGYTISNYARVLGDGYYLGVLGDTLLLALITTIVCLLLGTSLPSSAACAA